MPSRVIIPSSDGRLSIDEICSEDTVSGQSWFDVARVVHHMRCCFEWETAGVCEIFCLLYDSSPPCMCPLFFCRGMSALERVGREAGVGGGKKERCFSKPWIEEKNIAKKRSPVWKRLENTTELSAVKNRPPPLGGGMENFCLMRKFRTFT